MVSYWKNKHVCICGASGFLGSHLAESLSELGADLFCPQSNQYDLRQYDHTKAMLSHAGKVDILFNLAANVGGIGYNQLHPYDLYYDNDRICSNLIHLASQSNKVGKFVQLGTVCAYPKFTPVPFDERCLWDGFPEETNAPYGIAKRNALLHLQLANKQYGLNGIYILPTNLYGPRDHFEESRSHVIPALIKKFTDAMRDNTDIEIWGSGAASRDFLYVKDAIYGIMLLAEKYEGSEPVNLGSGNEVRIHSLVHILQQLFGFTKKVNFDTSKPDGQPRRGLRIWKAQELGWQPLVSLKDGLRMTIDWYRDNQ